MWEDLTAQKNPKRENNSKEEDYGNFSSFNISAS
jgi:hypothetical protein